MISPDVIHILYKALEEQLNQLGLTYQKPSGLSKGILESSQHFIQQLGPSPWTKPVFQASYIAHFLPMNVFRWLSLMSRLEEQKLNPFDSVLDFGAGPLTFRIAMALKYPEKNLNYAYVELSDNPIKIGEAILQSIQKSLSPNQKAYASNKTKLTKDMPFETLVLSYSLNELTITPEEFWSFKNILILEPSMQDVSRKLLELREQAFTKNFKPLAPCTHADQCPMLLNSKKDWCFDRTTIEIPDIARNLYKILPFETKHLTYSYLLLSQNKSHDLKAMNKNNNNDNQAEVHSLKNTVGRIVGDWQQEKGKRKIMLCRSSEREFISLLKKSSASANTGFGRGDKISLDFDYEIKGNELRLK